MTNEPSAPLYAAESRAGGRAALMCLAIAVAASPCSAGSAVAAPPPRGKANDRCGDCAEERADRATVIDLVSFHRPNYFVTGFTAETQVEFQFSVKYNVWPNHTGHAVFFAYTQKSLWDLWDIEGSSPFTENNYNPELFYTFFADRPTVGCGYSQHRVSLEHESNGEGGAQSRGWNRVSAGTRFACGTPHGTTVYWSLRLWIPFLTPDNPDIADYVGYGEVSLRAISPERDRWYGRAQAGVILRKGASRRGSALLEGRWLPGGGSVRKDFWRFSPYLYSQLFAGHAETLESYDRRTLSFRFGLGFDDQWLPMGRRTGDL